MVQTIQFRRGTAAQWTSANPILAEGEMGVELDTKFYKIGDGVTAWNNIAYGVLRTIDTINVASLIDQGTPTPPQEGILNLYAKTLSGRMMLRQQGPSGLVTPLQPSFFQNNITLINTNVTTTLTSIGNTVTSVGTISHPVITEAWGLMANIMSAATALATAGTGNTTLLWVRGSVAGGANGFFYNARLGFPDASYDQAGVGTGSRIFAGFTDQTMATTVIADVPFGNYCGFIRRSVNGGAIDPNWMFETRNGIGGVSIIDTTFPFYAQEVYDFYIFSAPQGSKISWRIDNVTRNTSQSGETATMLPINSTYMRAGFQLGTVNAVSRNIRMQRVYVESDR